MTNTTSRFQGAVHDELIADAGVNRDGESVIRLDLNYTRGTAPSQTTMIISLAAASALQEELARLLDNAVEDTTDDAVDPEDACPNCGERRQDLLVWFENADQVQCESCGHVYAPPRAAKTAGNPRSEPRNW